MIFSINDFLYDILHYPQKQMCFYAFVYRQSVELKNQQIELLGNQLTLTIIYITYDIHF